MSCERNHNLVSARAGTVSGITATASKTGFAYGATLNHLVRMTNRGLNSGLKTIYTLDEARAKAEAVGAAMLNLAGPPERGVKQAVKRAVTGTLGTSAKLALLVAMGHPGVRLAVKIAKSVNGFSKVAGSGIAALSKTREAGQVMHEKRMMFFFKKEVPVALWQSTMTHLLNRADVVGDPNKIMSSDGVMFRLGQLETWHRGTTTVKMPDGKRTITHLQSLVYPQSHYYFDRPISNEASVGIAANKIKPEAVAGYVGRVSPLEGMSPTLMMAKQSMIKAYLHYGARS